MLREILEEVLEALLEAPPRRRAAAAAGLPCANSGQVQALSRFRRSRPRKPARKGVTSAAAAATATAAPASMARAAPAIVWEAALYPRPSLPHLLDPPHA